MAKPRFYPVYEHAHPEVLLALVTSFRHFHIENAASVHLYFQGSSPPPINTMAAILQ